VPNKKEDNQVDLIEAVDSLLEDIEETTQTYAPEGEKAIDTTALLNDVGEVVTQPKPTDSPPDPIAEATDEADEDLETEGPEVVDSIENAKQALDALDEVETQAEDLVAQSVDALLDDAETATAPQPTEPEAQDEAEAPEPADTEAVAPHDPQTADEPAAQPEATEIAEADIAPDDAQAEEIDTDALLDSIDELLEETESQSPAADPATDTSEEPESVEAHAEEPTDKVAEPEIAAAPEPAASPEPTAVAEIASEAVSEIVPEDMEAELTVEHAAPSADSLDESMDMLDSALAEAADDMLDGDFETEDGELVSGEAVASAIEEALEAQPKPDADAEILNDAADALMEPEDTPAPAPAATEKPVAAPAAERPAAASAPAPEAAPAPAQEKQAVEPAATAAKAEIPDSVVQSEIEALEEIKAKEPYPVPAWFERGIEIVRPKIDKIDPLKGKTMDTIAMALGAVIVTVMTQTTPILARLMILVSKPLAKKSPEFRNAVGYIALWTGFLAIALWAYLLMFRSASIPQPETAPTRVISVDEATTPDPSNRAEP